MEQGTPPGWYSHPDTGRLEYWDGQGWRSKVAPTQSTPVHAEFAENRNRSIENNPSGWAIAAFVFLVIFGLVWLFVALAASGSNSQ